MAETGVYKRRRPERTDYYRIIESRLVLGLSVEAPACRDNWHMESFLGALGHPTNRVGVKVDQALRPVGPDGVPFFENVFVVGALLACHDWVREKSGAGISVATGHAAVESILALRRKAPTGGVV
jgi:anaerobic glycerol-3-phosphate dehydrogenase